MPINVNQDMVDFVADDDTIEGTITVSANVDPGNVVSDIGELFGFDPDVVDLAGPDVATLQNQIIELWDDLIASNIVFVPNDEDAVITINGVTNLPPTSAGVTKSTLHTVFPLDVDVFLPNLTIMAGTQTWSTAVHEFGHALGLRHPGEYNATDDVRPTYQNSRQFDEDTVQYTIMSYFNPGADGSGANWNPGLALTPMIYDILAIQQLYGADTTTRTEDTTYGFNGTTGPGIYNFALTGIGTFVPVMTIWDAGGKDTLDFSLYSVGQRIDLSPGSYSDAGSDTSGNALVGNFGIAFDTWIEDARGGSGNDTITGNALDNRLEGNDGLDTLKGLDGHDTLIGGKGEDTLEGGSGNDTLDGGDEGDFLYGQTGNDTLTGGIGGDYLNGGFGTDTLDGGADNDVIDGGGSGDGGPGIAVPDLLTGGTGTDTFIYQRAYKATVITDFNTRAGEDDIIDMRSEFANIHRFTELLARAQQVGNDVVFNFGAVDPQAQFDKLTLKDQTIGALDPSQFLFSEDPNSPPAEFQIVTNPDFTRPVLTDSAALADGGFVTATATIQTYYQQTIFGNRFDHRGVNVGSFAINSTPLNFGNSHNQTPLVETLADGRIVAAWRSEDSGVYSIRARLFSADLQPLGADFLVNSIPAVGLGTNYTLVDAITPLEGGGFSVTWETDTDPASNIAMVTRTRAFDASGAPTTGDLVTSYTVQHIQLGSGVGIALGDGRALHFWQEQLTLNGPPYTGPGPMWAQITGEVPVLIGDTHTYNNGTVTRLEDGRFEFLWQTPNSGTYTVILDSDLHGFTKPGTPNADTLKGGIYNDQLYGLGGDDTLIGGRGPDILDGGAGSDTADYDASLEGVHIDLSDGAPESGGHANGDVLIDIENIKGSGYADTIIGDYHDNRLDGSYGNDTINGGLGNDLIYGGRGNDTLTGGGGYDQIYGGAGNDTITVDRSALGFGEAGDDHLILHDWGAGYGGDNDDMFDVYGSNIVAYGNEGEDSFDVVGNNNSVYMGDFEVADDVAWVTGNNNTVMGSNGENTIRIESGSGNYIDGGGGDDTLRNHGDGDGNILAGGRGADRIEGGTGKDFITTDGPFGDGELPSEGDVVDAGGGDDQVLSFGNGDELDGGSGTDTLILDLSWRTDAMTATFSGVVRSVAEVSEDWTTIKNFEIVTLMLGEGADTVTGTGADTPFAGTLRLYGGWGTDTLTGGDGDDLVVGGADDDLLAGGGGADTFVWGTDDGTDTVTDFTVGVDKIDLTGVAGKYGMSDLAIAQVGADTVITLGSGIILQNVQMSSLQGSDFIFATDLATIPQTNSVVTSEDTASAGILIDPNHQSGSNLSFSVSGFGPALGNVTFADGRFIYTPRANANGADSFIIAIEDGLGGYTEQAVSVTVTAVDDTFDVTPAAFAAPGAVFKYYGGFDTMRFTAPGTVVAANLAEVTGVEEIAFAVGGVSVAVDDTFITGNPGNLTVTGSSGNDIFDASAVTLATSEMVITAGTGTDTFRGGAGADTFLFSGRTTGDTVSGGGGGSIDTLRFTTGVTLLTADTAGLSGLERIVLASGTNNSIFLTDALVASAEGTTLEVIGGSGNDAVYGGNIRNGAHNLDISAGTGTETLRGGLGADTFRFAIAELTAADSVNGDIYAGDRLVFSTAGTIGAGAFAQVSGIEQLELADGTNSITLADAMVQSAHGAVLAVIGSSGNDTVDGSLVTGPGNRLDITAGGGVDTLIGGAGSDSFRIAAGSLTGADTFVGGEGAAIDALGITTAGTLAAASLAGVSGMERIYLFAGTNSLTIDDTVAAHNPALIIKGNTGNDTIDASALSAAYHVWIVGGAGNDTVKGGAGADRFQSTIADLTAADLITGGNGAALDEFSFLDAGTITAAQLGGLSGIERLYLAAGTNTLTLTDAVAAANAALVVKGGVGNDTIDFTALSAAHGLTVVGGAGDDTLKGGVGSDTFQFKQSELTASDTVSGGSGAALDWLTFTTAGTLSASALLGVSGMERLQLTTGTNSLTITDAVAAANAGLVVKGGGGADTVDGSALGSTHILNVRAAAGADILVGGAGNDILEGEAGNDSLTGNGGNNTLTGGADQDSFRFLARDHATDRVTDFLAADDTLVFEDSAFDFNGAAFNARTLAASTATDITGADLVVYTGGALDSAADVQAYLAAAAGGSVSEGLFIVGINSGGETVLFHAADASATNSTDVDFIATLGTLTAATALQLGDFAFV